MPDRERPLAGERPPKPLTRCYDRRRQALRRPLEPGQPMLKVQGAVDHEDSLRCCPPQAYPGSQDRRHIMKLQEIGPLCLDDPSDLPDGSREPSRMLGRKIVPE